MKEESRGDLKIKERKRYTTRSTAPVSKPAIKGEKEDLRALKNPPIAEDMQRAITESGKTSLFGSLYKSAMMDNMKVSDISDRREMMTPIPQKRKLLLNDPESSVRVFVCFREALLLFFISQLPHFSLYSKNMKSV